MAGESELRVPRIYNADGIKMTPRDLKTGDILVVRWAEPAKYSTETSIVRFVKFGEGVELDPRAVVVMSRSESELLIPCCYPLEEILEMRFCAHDSSASSQVFDKLNELYKENLRLKDRLSRIEKRFSDLLI